MKSDTIDYDIIHESQGSGISPSLTSSPYWTFRKSMKVYLVGAILGTMFSIISGIYFGEFAALSDISSGLFNKSGTTYFFINKPLIAFIALPFLGSQMVISIVFFYSLFKLLKGEGQKGRLARAGIVLLIISYIEQFVFLYTGFMIASGNSLKYSSQNLAGFGGTITDPSIFFSIGIFLLIGLIVGVLRGTQILSDKESGKEALVFPALVLAGLFIFPVGIISAGGFLLIGNSWIKKFPFYMTELIRRLWKAFLASRRIQIVTAISGIIVSMLIIASFLFGTPVYSEGYFAYLSNPLFPGGGLLIAIFICPLSQFASITALFQLFKKKVRFIRSIVLTLYVIPFLFLGILETGGLGINSGNLQFYTQLTFILAILDCGLLSRGLFVNAQHKWSRATYNLD